MDQYDNHDATDDVKALGGDRLDRMKRPRDMMIDVTSATEGCGAFHDHPGYEFFFQEHQERSRRNRPSDLTTAFFLSMGECVREAECGMRGEFLCATAADIFCFDDEIRDGMVQKFTF